MSADGDAKREGALQAEQSSARSEPTRGFASGEASGALRFDEAAARALERMYTTPDIVGQRARFVQLLAPRAGERILDIGIGPGFLVADLAPIVGDNGLVAGIDQSAVMLEVAKKRCEGKGPVDFRQADATSLPFEGASFDAVTSTQVYEYVPDMEQALAEVRRVLEPGGRVFILDTDWDSVVWFTDDRARMRRVMGAWDEHLHDAHLPTRLGALLAGAGLRVTHVEVFPLVNPSLHRHCYSHGILGAIASFVPGRRGVTQEEADAWLAEQRALGAAGRYFFSISRTVFGALKL